MTDTRAAFGQCAHAGILRRRHNAFGDESNRLNVLLGLCLGAAGVQGPMNFLRPKCLTYEFDNPTNPDRMYESNLR